MDPKPQTVVDTDPMPGSAAEALLEECLNDTPDTPDDPPPDAGD